MGEQISTKPINSDKLWYHCIDGKIVLVDPLCCHESYHVRKHMLRIEEKDKESVPLGIKGAWWNYLDDKEKFGHSPIPVQITSNILSIVNDFCVSRAEVFRCHNALPKKQKKKECLTKKLHQFDVDFIEKNHRLSLLVRLMEAASQMGIASLLDITSKAVVDIMGDLKSPKKFLKIFSLPDLTHEVWKDPSVVACARYLESTSAPLPGRQQPATSTASCS